MTYSEENIKKARKKLLDETVAYYSEDTSRRGLSQHGGCVYRGINDTKCAIGRLIPDEQYTSIIESSTPIGISENARVLCSVIPLEYLCLGKHFLDAIQTLHDSESIWNEKGITKYGRDMVDSLERKYCQ